MLFQLYSKHFYIQPQNVSEQIDSILRQHHTHKENFAFYANGKIITSFESLSTCTITALVPLVGGKGGYGAKLKTQGGKKVRPNDNMFSRDAQGQRVVYATMERQYKQFVAQKIQQDKRVAQQRQQFKVMENTLKEGKSFMKLNKNYKKELQQTQMNLAESIKMGKKRAMEQYQQEIKKAKEDKQKSQFAVKPPPKEQNEEFAVKPMPVDEVQEHKQQRKSPKRELPQQNKEEICDIPGKKIKVDVPEPAKPKMLSAQQKFKALFKK